MDPIEDINPKEDSTFAIITALQKNHNIEYIIPDTIHLINQDVFAKTKKLKTFKRKKDFYKLSRSTLMNLSKLDCILFRKDPPVDEKYIQITHMLDYLEKNGVLIINSPQSLRDYNEKLLGNNLTKFNLPTLISSNQEAIVNFVQKYKKTRFVRTGNDRTVSKVHNYLKLLLSPTAYNAQTQGTEKNKLIDIIDTVISANPNKYIII